MSIKIAGKKYINSDSYDRISIEKSREDILIRATSNTEEKELKDKGIIKKIYNLSENEQLEYIINSYLKNNNINRIVYNRDLRCVSDKEKVFYFKSDSFNKEYIKKIYNRVFYDYDNDRASFINNNKVQNYVVTTHEKYSEYKLEDDIMYIVLSTNDRVLEEYEVEFLVNFLITKLASTNEDIKLITRKWNEFNMDIPCLELFIGDTFINFDKDNKDLKELVTNVYSNYKNNEERGR